ncbi:cytochrome P450 [Kalaharituber pfeilii]|nr:cytochrome P450 [Kalaharituber pfeilii]
MSILLQALVGLLLGYLIYHLYCLYCNIRIARTIGLPYVVTPVFEFGVFWMIFGRFLHPLIKCYLPSFLTKSWEPFLAPDWHWNMKHGACKLMKTDVFLIVSPTAIIMSVADADMINEIVTRREDFPKPMNVYPPLEIYGMNIASANGEQWKTYRRIITPSFNEKMNQLVWTTFVEKTKLLRDNWVTPVAPSTEPPDVRTLSNGCYRLAFHVWSWVGCRLQLTWPKQLSGNSFEPYPDEKIGQSHSMSFQSAMHFVLARCFFLAGAPKWYLQLTPYKPHRKAWLAYKEWEAYMKEIAEERKKELDSGKATTVDTLSAMVSAYYSGAEGKGEKGKRTFTKEELFGNILFMMFGGHSTTARTLHYAIMMLAIHPEYQKPLQEDFSKILGDRDPDYDKDFKPLMSGWCGAIINETFRLYSQVANIPKATATPQTIVYNNKMHVIPAFVVIHLNVNAVQRNPKYWVLPNQTEEEAQINEFRPQRWFLNNDSSNFSSSSSDESDNENDGTNSRGHTSKSFKPCKGSFVPFSDGPRVCLGKKYAQVALMAAMSVLFREHRVELVVKEGETWEEARVRARRYVENSGMGLTLAPKGQEVGVRFVRNRV